MDTMRHVLGGFTPVREHGKATTLEKDVLLLRKLATSKYDTAKEDTSPDTDLKRQRRQLRRNGKRIAMETLSVSIRNASTDWNVTKGPSQVRRAR